MHTLSYLPFTKAFLNGIASVVLGFSCCLSPDLAVADSLNDVLTRTKAGDRFHPFYELTFQYINIDNGTVLRLIEDAERVV